MTDSILRSYHSYTHTSMVPFPVAEGLFLDTYPSAAFAYSLRKLRTAYAGSAVRIRRSSDNAEADIGFSGNDFDTVAAAAHIGGGSGFIVTWYDQSGNGLDVTQATAGNQPTYSATGLVSKPSVQLVSSDTLSRASVNLGTVTNGTLLSVMEQDTSGGDNTLIGFNAGGARLLTHATFGDVIYWDFGSGGGGGRINFSQPVGWDNNPHILELYRDNSDVQGIVVDGVSLGTASRTDDISGTSLLEVGNDNSGHFHTGYISELIFWTPDLGSSNRTAARTNINTYYAVF